MALPPHYPEPRVENADNTPTLQALYPTTSNRYPDEHHFEKKPSDLTGVLITHNHEHCIERALVSMEGCTHQLLIIDQGSTDNTLAIVRKYTSRIIYTPSTDLYWVLHQIRHHIHTPWALWLRADEWLPREAQLAMTQHLKQHPNATEGCTLTHQPRWHNTPLQWGGFNVSALRLFRPEHVTPHPEATLTTPYVQPSSGKAHHLKPIIPVEPFANLTALLNEATHHQSHINNTFRQTDPTSASFSTLAPIITFLTSTGIFIWHYLIRLGWLDGSAGFLWAWRAAHQGTLRHLFKNEQAIYSDKQRQRRS